MKRIEKGSSTRPLAYARGTVRRCDGTVRSRDHYRAARVRGCEKMLGIQFRQDGLGMPSPYVVENKRSSVGARHASTVFRAQRAIFSQPLSKRSGAGTLERDYP